VIRLTVNQDDQRPRALGDVMNLDSAGIDEAMLAQVAWGIHVVEVVSPDGICGEKTDETAQKSDERQSIHRNPPCLAHLLINVISTGLSLGQLYVNRL